MLGRDRPRAVALRRGRVILQFLNLRTSAGEFGLVGRVHADARPGLLVLNGSFPSNDLNHNLVGAFPEASVVVANLPGMLGTPWSGLPPAELSRGLDQAAARLFGPAPIIVVGVSTGNLVTLGMRSPRVRRHVCVEPFLETKDLWPFIDWCQAYARRFPQDEALAGFLWDFFGYRGTSVENRDYRALVDGVAAPIDVITGSLPLMPKRPMTTWPSLTSPADRALFAAHPRAVLHPSPPDSGHALLLTPAGAALTRRVLADALAAVAA